jgi:hypothetical protein
MLSSHRLVCFLVGCLVLVLTGCTKVKDEMTFELKPNERKEFEVPVQKSDMKLTVEVISDKAPIIASIGFMGEGDDAPKFEQQKEPSKNFTLSLDIPANKASGVVVHSILHDAEPTNVTVKITGK